MTQPPLYLPRVRADSERLPDLIRYAALQFKENGWRYARTGVSPLSYFQPEESDLALCVYKLLLSVRARGGGYASSGRWLVESDHGDGHVWVVFLGDDYLPWLDAVEDEVPA